MWDRSVMTLLSIRFMSFLFELVVDFFIDLELDYDLREGIIHKLPIITSRCTQCCGNIALELQIDHSLDAIIPNGWSV